MARSIEEQRDYRGNRMICKIKGNTFLTKESKPKKEMKPKEKIPPEIIEFVNNAVDSDRLSSVYSHGEFEPAYAMSDMKHLVRLVPADIKAEGHEIWDRYPEDKINRVIVKRLPVVLQSFLLERLK